MSGCAGTESGGSKRALVALLRRGGRLGDAGQVIVYATFQKQAASVAAFLDANGISAAAYHAGKAPQVCSIMPRIAGARVQQGLTSEHRLLVQALSHKHAIARTAALPIHA